MRPIRSDAAIIYLWVLWVVSWLLAAVWANRTERRPPVRVEAGYRAIQAVGVLLLFWPSRLLQARQLWLVDRIDGWACVALVAVGMAIAWWARLHLGRLWSGHITRKSDHKIVDTGPYAMVRHPIYTGLLLALAATAADKATWPAVLGSLLLWLSFYLKARIEERWLSQELGAEAYADYQRRVPMLVPMGWGRRR